MYEPSWDPKRKSRQPPKEDERPALYREVFGTPAGQRVLDDICRHAELPKADYDRLDPQKLAFKEGKRNVADYIVERLRPDEDRK